MKELFLEAKKVCYKHGTWFYIECPECQRELTRYDDEPWKRYESDLSFKEDVK